MNELGALSFDLRKDVVNMIVEGKGGHIGGDMSVIDILITLYFRQMNISPENQEHPDRDLFVLSKGHCVEALYAVLAAKGFFTIEEHSPFGGLGAMVSQIVASNCPKKVINLSLPDEPVITGNSAEVFEYYGMTAEGIMKQAMSLLH